MTAYSLPELVVQGTVVDLDEDDLNFTVWVHPEESSDDLDAIRVSFQKASAQVDPTLIDVFSRPDVGELVEVAFVEFVDGETIIRRGRSIARR